MMHSTRSLILSVVVLLASAGIAAATTTATSNMTVQATVTNSCTISAGALNFGNYSPVAGADKTGTATLTVACTKDASAKITLGEGANAGGGSTAAAPVRRMNDGGTNYLSYALAQDVGGTVWGNTDPTGEDYTAVDNSPASVTVYGTITAGQNVPAGAYADTVVATITF
jgi:spore coat protein U domain-containing protein, fimbrial subunit CupE1/2/3/6